MKRFICLLTVGVLACVVFVMKDADRSVQAAESKVVILAGGCFWCLESDFDKVDGVLRTTSGYTGGEKRDPTYQEVSAGGTGHYEVVRVEYDPAKVSFEDLLYIFWRNVDPLDARGQFCDKGDQYRSAIFVSGEEELQAAEKSKADLQSSGRFNTPVVTEILPRTKFYPAEDYHQGYYKKNSLKYKYYRWSCGRDQRLEDVWGDEALAHVAP